MSKPEAVSWHCKHTKNGSVTEIKPPMFMSDYVSYIRHRIRLSEATEDEKEDWISKATMIANHYYMSGMITVTEAMKELLLIHEKAEEKIPYQA